MMERLLTVWFTMVITSLIIEIIRWKRKPKSFRWKFYDMDYWMVYNHCVIAITLPILVIGVLSLVIIYIIEGEKFFLS